MAVPLSEYMTCNMHTASITKDESRVSLSRIRKVWNLECF